MPNALASTLTAVTEPPAVVIETVMPLLVPVCVTEGIAAICASAIYSIVLPLTVRLDAATLVTENVAVLETFKFVKLPVEAVTTLSPVPL